MTGWFREGPSRRFAGIRSMGITGAVEVLAFEFGNHCSAVISLQKTAITASSGRGRLGCEAAIRQCCRPHPTVPRTGRHGLPSLAVPNSASVIDNAGNPARRPDLKVRHYL